MSASRSAERSAVASATSAEFSSAEETRLRSRASGASTVSPSTARRWSVSFSEARISRTLSTSLSAGLARRMTSLRSSPRPATPVPSSLRMIDSRARSGSRVMLLIRSRSTGLVVCETGSRYWPSPLPLSIFSSAGGGSAFAWRACVGSHSTNFSPISDWGRMMHSASRRKSW